MIPILVAAFCRLRIGLDEVSRPGDPDRRRCRPSGRAAADVADPAVETVQWCRRILRCAGQDLCGYLAGAYGLRSAARHLSVAQLYGRPAARNHGIGPRRRRQRFPISSSRSSCPCRSRRSHPSRSSSSCGPGTIFWSPWCSSEPATTNWSSPAVWSTCSVRAAATGKS